MSLDYVNGGYMKPTAGEGSGAVDSVNGQTGVVILTTGNVDEVTNKKYVTDAEKTKLSNLSGTNSGDQNSNTVPISSTLPAPLNAASTVQGALATIAPLLDHTVDSVNGQTGTVVLTTASIDDATDKRYVTDAEKTKLSNLSGTNSGDQNSSSVALSTTLPAPLNTAADVQGALEQIVPLLDQAVDSVNGQTGAVVLDTSDVLDTVDSRYVTEAEKTKLSNLSGTNSGDQNSSSVLLSAALPAPLASETTVQGALAAIAPYLGAGSGEAILHTFTFSGLPWSVGAQLRPTNIGWVAAQGNTIANATNVWTVVAKDGDDYTVCKAGRVTIPSHGLGSVGQLMYLSATAAGGLTSTKPVGTNSNFLGFFLPVIQVVDADTIDVLGYGYPQETNLLARHVVSGTPQFITFSGFSLNALKNKLRFEAQLQFNTTGPTLYWAITNSANPNTREEQTHSNLSSARSYSTTANLTYVTSAAHSLMYLTAKWRKVGTYYYIESLLMRGDTRFARYFQSFNLSSGSDITAINLWCSGSGLNFTTGTEIEVYAD